MMPLKALSLFALLLSTCLPFAASGQEMQKGIQGQKAPPLNVSDWYQLPAGKEKIEITDYEGKIVVLLFFQHWCQASQERELPVLQ